MTLVAADTAHGVYEVDLDDGEVTGPLDAPVSPARYEVQLPRLVFAAGAGSTIVAAVDAKPPLLVSYDAGTTWSESGRGLPPIVGLAVSEDDPDVVVAASRNRLHLSRDGGRFWETLDVELPEIRAVQIL
jgi:hypothetical protein